MRKVLITLSLAVILSCQEQPADYLSKAQPQQVKSGNINELMRTARIFLQDHIATNTLEAELAKLSEIMNMHDGKEKQVLLASALGFKSANEYNRLMSSLAAELDYLNKTNFGFAQLPIDAKLELLQVDPVLLNGLFSRDKKSNGKTYEACAAEAGAKYANQLVSVCGPMYSTTNTSEWSGCTTRALYTYMSDVTKCAGEATPPPTNPS